MISPRRLRASSMPSRVFPAAVGPRMARIGGRRFYILKNTRATAALRRIKRPNCCVRVGSAISSAELGRVLVVEERHRKKRRVGWILGRQRLRGIRAYQRIDCGVVEG